MSVPTPPKVSSEGSVKSVFTGKNLKNGALFVLFVGLAVGLTKMNRHTYREFHARPMRYLTDTTGQVGILESLPVVGMLFDKRKTRSTGTTTSAGGDDGFNG